MERVKIIDRLVYIATAPGEIVQVFSNDQKLLQFSHSRNLGPLDLPAGEYTIFIDGQECGTVNV